jgi:hypothetical protein
VLQKHVLLALSVVHLVYQLPPFVQLVGFVVLECLLVLSVRLATRVPVRACQLVLLLPVPEYQHVLAAPSASDFTVQPARLRQSPRRPRAPALQFVMALFPPPELTLLLLAPLL